MLYKYQSIVASAVLALNICGSAQSQESNVQFVKPGTEGAFAIAHTVYTPKEVRTIGKLNGREVELIDTPCGSCEMGKQMVVDSRDQVWFLQTREDRLGRIDPEARKMDFYKLPLGSGPYSLGVGPDDTIWMTAHGIEMLLEFIPGSGEVITHQPPKHGFLVHIAVDKKRGDVYMAQPGANTILRYNRDKGFIEYPIPTPNAGPARMAIEESGRVWFPELYANKLAVLDPASGDIKEWNLPTADGFPSFARIDDKGDIWVSQPMADRIVVFNPLSESFKEFVVPTKNSIVSTQVEDSNGDIYFTEGGWRGSAGGNKIGVMKGYPSKKVSFEELEIPINNAQPAGITIRQDGEIWFQLSAKGKIGRVKPIQH